MRAVVLLALSGVVRAIPTVSTPGRQLQSAQPDKCSDDASFQGTAQLPSSRTGGTLPPTHTPMHFFIYASMLQLF